MFDKILIANRGEIACRVARTAKRMGIKTVAVYSEADTQAMHVNACDEAYFIGASPATESYLCADKMLEIAKRSGAQAVHPGYGFLSENAAFAKACEQAGITFIGPPASAIVSMGSKSEAKILMTAAGVPLVPGYHGDDQSLQTLKAESEKVGFPQLIKATAGGGGKGMRVVESLDGFEAALKSCQREAKASFGDDKVLIERYLTAPRHIELQVFADTQGNAVHIFERDCSIQRRHQKVIEEAPAPGMTEALRAEMGKAAIDAAKAINYVGAGTVEFLLDTDGSFYFMEMNTRLQVEHPVTEMISGQDLVEWQFKVAAGQPLPVTQQDLSLSGHAFEARIYAEAPERDFLPATGTLQHLKTPIANSHVRIDTGVTQGDEVSMYYDPMIAKLIVWDTDRDNALRQMKSALSQYHIIGLSTNIAFLSRLFDAPAFQQADFDTGFIATHESVLLPEQTAEIPSDVIALTCLHEMLMLQQHTEMLQQRSNDPYSPWGCTTAWQANLPAIHRLELQAPEQDDAIDITVRFTATGYQLESPGLQGSIEVSGQLHADNTLIAVLDDRKLTATILSADQERSIIVDGCNWTLTLIDPHRDNTENEGHAGGLVAPMPGAVVSIDVALGDEVKPGDALMVVEAMKMEHTITAATDGMVDALYFQVGDQVEEGDELLSLRPSSVA